jgi:septum formation protein
MLTAAGVSFEILVADVDERAIREALTDGDAEIEPADIAEVLARAKAEAVSRLRPEALVIGADQVLALDGRIYEKPADIAAAEAALLQLRGRTHQLHAAVAIAEAGEVTWSAYDDANLTMREFSGAFLRRYLADVGPRVCESVGAYQLEGLGVNLFDRIEGDFFTILGMPLLPVLAELRARGMMAK